MIHTEKNNIKSKIDLPKYGLGCANLGNLYINISNKESDDIIKNAFKEKINYFDTAPLYGNGLSEHRLGNYFSDNDISDDFVISTKVGKLVKPVQDPFSFTKSTQLYCNYDYTYDGIMRSIEDSLNRLRLNKIDIVYLHDLTPFYNENTENVFYTAMKFGIKALDKLKTENVIKLVGLGENDFHVCNASLDYYNFDLFLIAGRYTIFEQTISEEFFGKCEKYDTAIVLGGPLNSGLMSNNRISSVKYNYADAPLEIINKSSEIKKICNKYNINPISAALQFPIFNKIIKTVLFGIQNQVEINQNIEYIHQKIPKEFWTEMKKRGFIKQFCPIN